MVPAKRKGERVGDYSASTPLRSRVFGASDRRNHVTEKTKGPTYDQRIKSLSHPFAAFA